MGSCSSKYKNECILPKEYLAAQRARNLRARAESDAICEYSQAVIKQVLEVDAVRGSCSGVSVSLQKHYKNEKNWSRYQISQFEPIQEHFNLRASQDSRNTEDTPYSQIKKHTDEGADNAYITQSNCEYSQEMQEGVLDKKRLSDTNYSVKQVKSKYINEFGQL